MTRTMTRAFQVIFIALMLAVAAFALPSMAWADEPADTPAQTEDGNSANQDVEGDGLDGGSDATEEGAATEGSEESPAEPATGEAVNDEEPVDAPVVPSDEPGDVIDETPAGEIVEEPPVTVEEEPVATPAAQPEATQEAAQPAATTPKVQTAAVTTKPATTTPATTTTPKTTTTPTTAPKTTTTTTAPKTSAQTTSTKTTLKAAATTNVRARTLADGIYYIESKLNVANVLDVAGASKNKQANVNSSVYNGKANQRWKIVYNSKTGMYSIVNVNSGLALDVAGGKAANGTNIEQYSSNNTKAQQWYFVKQNGGYRIVSALANSVLDISGANKSSGANVQLYASNGTDAQTWVMLSTNPVKAGTVKLAEGTYIISSKAKTSEKLDVEGMSTANSGNVHIWAANKDLNQRWYITADKDNYYTIKNVQSGKVLDIANAKMVAGANVQQYASNNSNAQKWVLKKNSDGSYTFISKLNGMALDLAGGKTTDGTNAQMYLQNGTKAQCFVLSKQKQMIPNGLYTISPTYNTKKVLDIDAAKMGNNAQVQIWDYEAPLQQKFQVKHIGNGVYTMMAAHSGKYITSNTAGNNLVQSTFSATNKRQQWKATLTNDGITFKNVANGKVIDIAGAGTANGTKADVYKSNGTNAQKFILKKCDVIDDGVYIFNSYVGTGNKVLEIGALSTKNGGNAQIWSPSNGLSQRFFVRNQGDGYFKLINVASGKALDVAEGSKTNGANVQQWAENGGAAQLWKAEVSPNGGVVFINKASGKALDVSGGKDVNGANADSWAKNGTNAQRWKATPSTSLTDLQLVAYRKAVSHGSKTNWYIATDLSHHRVYFFKRKDVDSNWELVKDVIMTSGQPSYPTPTGEYTIKRKFYAYDGYYGDEPYTAYYYNSIGNTGKYFHSPLYGRGAPPGSKSYGGWGKNLSLGCVRLHLDDIKYMFNNVPKGTHISIYR